MVPPSPIRTLPVLPLQRTAPFTVVAFSLLTLWVFAWLLGPSVLSLLDLSLNSHGHAALHAHGHPFVDARSWWGVPNTLDVLSNLPPAVLVLAVVSAVLPHLQGNVLPWAVVQFGGMGLVVWAATRSSAQGAIGVSLAGLIALYAVAKLLELGDEALFRATGEWVSGHSLKHVAAACAALPVLWRLKQRRLGDNAPVHPTAMG